MDDSQNISNANKLAALAHPVRLDIVRQLANSNACCVKELVNRSDLAQSTISQHLKKLLNAGLVRYKTRSQSSWYELDRQEFENLSKGLDEIFHLCCQGCDKAKAEQLNMSQKDKSGS